MYICIYVCVCIYIYIYIYTLLSWGGLSMFVGCDLPCFFCGQLHPVCCLRFVSDWTQPLEFLSADSEFICYYLSTKRCLGNPTLGTNLGQRILAMRKGSTTAEHMIVVSVGGKRTQRAMTNYTINYYNIIQYTIVYHCLNIYHTSYDIV